MNRVYFEMLLDRFRFDNYLEKDTILAEYDELIQINKLLMQALIACRPSEPGTKALRRQALAAASDREEKEKKITSPTLF